jgi:hypothetical protein
MIHDTLRKIEDQLRESPTLKDENKAELIELLGTLRQEIGALSQTDPDQAQSVAGFAQVSAHEATRGTRNPKTLQLAIDGLSSSVTGFEESHPRLVKIVNSICVTLSNWGI